ncbi:hypothetical protein ACT4UT_22710 [Bacillus sp. B-TM1]
MRNESCNIYTHPHRFLKL